CAFGKVPATFEAPPAVPVASWDARSEALMVWEYWNPPLTYQLPRRVGVNGLSISLPVRPVGTTPAFLKAQGELLRGPQAKVVPALQKSVGPTVIQVGAIKENATPVLFLKS